MSTAIFHNFQGPDKQPANFPFGIRVGGSGITGINNIGIPGSPGFGVGICPGPLPEGMSPMSGYDDPMHDNYGNYQYTDGSVMVWIPAFYYKWGTGANGIPLNDVDIKPLSHWPDVASANAQGYAMHRAYYDGDALQPGVFEDKYQCSNNGGIASSIKNKQPLSASSEEGVSPFSALNGSPSNNLSGAIIASKTRGQNFFTSSRFIFSALALLSYAHAQASTSTAWCAWYHPTNNFPKGCNNNALRDVNDLDVKYIETGYQNQALTGSANLFARTTHNGQMCGVADLNGNMWEVTPGVTTLDSNLYILKTSARMKDLTGGLTLPTNLWGELGVAQNYDLLGTTFGEWNATGESRSLNYGSTEKVFSEAVSGNNWNWAGAGGMILGGGGGTNRFGNDRFYDNVIQHLCSSSGGGWTYSLYSGVWAWNLSRSRTYANTNYGFRSALYL